jgi:hypothetical protein
MKPFLLSFAVSILVLLPSGCKRSTIEIAGQAGRDIHDPSALIIQEQYLVEYTIKNTSSKELTINRVEEVWAPNDQKEGLTETVVPEAGTWQLSAGQAKAFVSGTDGYTLQLAAAGRPIEFSVSVYFGDDGEAGPFTAVLPELRTLPEVDHNILLLKDGDLALPGGLRNLPVQPMQPITFARRRGAPARF